MAPINKAIALLQDFDKPSISESAKKFKVERFTLSKHFHGKRGSITKANEKK
jgi:hypothetical protein